MSLRACYYYRAEKFRSKKSSYPALSLSFSLISKPPLCLIKQIKEQNCEKNLLEKWRRSMSKTQEDSREEMEKLIRSERFLLNRQSNQLFCCYFLLTNEISLTLFLPQALLSSSLLIVLLYCGKCFHHTNFKYLFRYSLLTLNYLFFPIFIAALILLK